MRLLNPDLWSIRTKLYSVSAAMLSTMAALVAFAVFEARAVEEQVAQINTLSSATKRVTDLDLQFEIIRRSLVRFAYDHDQDSLDQFKDTFAKADAGLKAAIEVTASDERRQTYRALAADMPRLKSAGDEMSDAADEVEQGKKMLAASDDGLAAASKDLAGAIARENNPFFSLIAQRLDSALLGVRVANWRGEARADDKGGEAVNAAAAEANRLVERLQSDDKSEAALAALETLKTSLANYAAVSAAVIDDLAKERLAYRESILPLLVGLQSKVQAPKAQLDGQFAQARAQVGAVISRSEETQEILVAGILFFGGVIAYFITRSITRPLVGLTAGMRRLAKGDFTFVLPELGRTDEAGEIAGAVEEFKVKAAEKAHLEAGETALRQAREAEAQAAVAAEREKAASEQAAVMDVLGDALNRLANKDLAFRLSETMPQAYRKLQTDFNTAIAQLQEALRNVNATSKGVQTGTAEIATAADDLSRRTEQQAARLEETSAALEEITSTVRATAQGAKQAREIVAATRDDAEKSGDVVRKAVDAMGRIEKSSQQISQIIGVIDEIAFQTNLLALNAGVEAARAGDAGRGFAVVASEVRALAQRSAEAAKEIKGLILTSTAQVSDGVNLVAVTGQTLERILAQVAKINSVVVDIATSAQEQATGLEHVNSAVGEMDQMTQQNAAMAEQATASSRSLSQESEQLARLIGQFGIGGADEARGRGGSQRRAAA